VVFHKSNTTLASPHRQMITFLLYDQQMVSAPSEVILQPESEATSKCSIGRASKSHLMLESQEISRIHAKVIYHEGFYYFLDPGSTCGSLINNETVPIGNQQLLRIGDEIKLGRFRLTVTNMD
jgi:glycine betaine catabolism B